MTTYRGFEVLTIAPEWGGARGNDFRRHMERVDSGYGAVGINDFGGRNFGASTYSWWCDSKASAQVLRDFIDARRGRLVPFWVPTWNRDLTLNQAATSTDAGIVIKQRGYTNHMWQDTARRDIVIWLASGPIFRRITGSTQTSSTETLTLNAVLGADVPVGTNISFLTFARIDTDEPEIVWETSQFATCELPIVEIPREVP